MKTFGFIKKVFFVAISIFHGITVSATPLKCVSTNNQKCKVRPGIVNVIVMNLYFILLELKQVNAVVAVRTSMIHMQKCVFLMLLKI